jgi:hypothetical protein
MAAPLFVDSDSDVRTITATNCSLATSSVAGNRLVAFVFENDNQLDDVTIQFAPSTGWVETTPPGDVIRLATGHHAITGRIFQKLSCIANENVSVNFMSPSGPIYPGLIVVEVSGAHASIEDDVQVSGSGSANLLTLTSPGISRADVLWLAFFASGNKDLHAIPAGDTSGFVLAEAPSSGGSGDAAKISSSVLWKQASSIGQAPTASVDIAGTSNHNYVGLMIGIPGAGGGGGGGGGSAGADAAIAFGMTPSNQGVVRRALSGHYSAQIPNLATAQLIASKFDIDVANVDTNPSTNQITTDRYNGFLPEMRAVNPQFKAGPYTKTAVINEGQSYYPNDYYAHDCPWPTGAKINQFSSSIWVGQPSVVGGQSSFVDPRGWTAHSFKEQRARDSWAIVDRYNTVEGTGSIPDPLQFVYGDSMGTSSFKSQCDPATGSPYTKAQWVDLVQTIGDELRSRGGGRPVFANGLISGASYFGGGGGQDLLNHVDGGLAENWLRNNMTSLTSFHTETGWQQDVDMVIDANTRGKLFWGVVNICNFVAGNGTCPAYSASDIERVRRYAIATYLIADRGWALFEFMENTNTGEGWEETHPYYDLDLGAPLDTAASAVLTKHTEPSQPAGFSTYVYRRRFSFGVAFLNPTANSVRITLDRAYKDPAGIGTTMYAAGSTIDLASNRGLVLETQAAAPPNLGAPTTAFTGPATTVQTVNVTATATASDPDGIASAEFRLNGGAWQAATFSGGVWSKAFTLNAGAANTIDFRATDANASPLTSTVITRTVTHDANGEDPTVTINAPGASVGVAVQLVQVTASDPDGIASVQVAVNDVNQATAAVFNSGTGKWEKSVSLIEGNNTIYARATDAHGTPRTSAWQSVLSVLTSSVTPDNPPEPTPTVPTLGLGRYVVRVLPRGGTGARALFTLNAWTEIGWARKRGETSEAKIVIAGGDVAKCCDQLADLRTWKHEIHIVRNGTGIWRGPLIDYLDEKGTITLTARDRSVWFDRRGINRDIVYGEPGVDVGQILHDYVAEAMREDPSPTISAVASTVGRKAVRSILAASHTKVRQALDDLRSAGLDWTTINEKVYAIVPGASLTTLTDASFVVPPSVHDDGLALVNNPGVIGAGGGETDAIFGEAIDAASVAEFGLLTDYESVSEITTVAEAQTEAGVWLADSAQPSLIVSGGTLSANTALPVALLIPGNRLTLNLQDRCRPVKQLVALESVVGKATATTESIDVALAVV